MKRGVTLLEMIVVIGILGVLLAIAMPSYRNFQKSVEVTSIAENIEGVLRETQSESMAVKNGQKHGVYFNSSSNQYIKFEGDAYVSGDPNNIIYQISDKVEMTDISLAVTGNSVVFEKLNGGTDNYGSVTITHATDTSFTKSINISHEGKISL